MKKSLLALAVFGAFATTASAQVTLYGALDAAYGVTEVETNDGGVINNEETTGMLDGGDVTAGSRWGIKVSSDLGNGLKGIAHLESSVNTPTGASSGFTRRAVVGVAGGFGTVLLGRYDNPLKGVMDDTGAFGGSGFDTATYAHTYDADGNDRIDARTGDMDAGFASRRSNSINYISPSFGGLSAKLQFAKQETEVTGTTPSGNDSTGFGVGVAYENGPFMVAVGYDNEDADNDTVTAAGSIDKTTWAVGGTYDLGVAKLFAQYASSETEVTGSTQEGIQYNIGAKVPMGAFTFLASVGRNEFEETGLTGDYTGTDYVLGVNYNLAKTTYVYARAGSFNNYEGAGFDTETTGYAVGLRHAF